MKEEKLDPQYRFKVTDGEYKGQRCQILTQGISVPTEDGGATVYRAVKFPGDDIPKLVPLPYITDAWTLHDFAENFHSNDREDSEVARFKWLQNNAASQGLTVMVYADQTYATNVDPVSGDIPERWAEIGEVRFNLAPLTEPEGMDDILTALGLPHEVEHTKAAPAIKKRAALEVVK